MKCDDKVKQREMGQAISFVHEDSPNNCSYLKLDVEEHPKLDAEDLRPLGLELKRVVDDYIHEHKGLQIVEHSSSYHIMNGDECWAKVWYDGMASSQIATKKGAKLVAEKFVELMEDKSKIEGMPVLRHIISMDYNCVIRNNKGEICKFVRTSDAEKFIEEHGDNKYNQSIKEAFWCSGGMKLCKEGSTAETISIFKECEGDRDFYKDILYDLREYIHTDIVEAH